MSKHDHGDLVHQYPDGWRAIWSYIYPVLEDDKGKNRAEMAFGKHFGHLQYLVLSPYARICVLFWTCIGLTLASAATITYVLIANPYQHWYWITSFLVSGVMLFASPFIAVGVRDRINDKRRGFQPTVSLKTNGQECVSWNSLNQTITVSNNTNTVVYEPVTPLGPGRWVYNTGTSSFTSGSITVNTTITTNTTNTNRFAVSDDELEITRRPDIIEDDQPILATRYAGLRVYDGKAVFLSVGINDSEFGIIEDAVCRSKQYRLTNGSEHRAPDWDCSCGFWAVPADKLPKHASDYGSQLILQVELSGDIIVHDEGYRAEHQEVLQVMIPDCPFCDEPVRILWISAQQGQMFGMDCGNHMYRCGGTGTWPPDQVPSDLCASLSLEKASQMLGVPFVRYDRKRPGYGGSFDTA